MVSEPPDAAPASAPVISTEGLVKRFSDVEAVAGIDLRVPAGGVYCFLGPNGAGKTTTIRLLVGLLRPTRGVATLFGEPTAPVRPVLDRVRRPRNPDGPSGALTLVAALVYAVAETAVLLLLQRFPEYQSDGELEWVPTLLPVRGLAEITNVAGRAANGLPSYPGEVVPRSLDTVALPLLALAVVTVLFASLAHRRFGRMDIVE